MTITGYQLAAFALVCVGNGIALTIAARMIWNDLRRPYGEL